jgi:hypothetical protein
MLKTVTAYAGKMCFHSALATNAAPRHDLNSSSKTYSHDTQQHQQGLLVQMTASHVACWCGAMMHAAQQSLPTKGYLYQADNSNYPADNGISECIS